MLLNFLLIILLLIILSFVWPPDSPWSPWWRTNKKVSRAACKLAKVTDNDIIYELGSGDGEFILTASSEFGAKKAVGIEIDHIRYWISNLRKKIVKSKNASFIRRDFKKVNLSDATVIYFYLVPRVIKRLIPKLRKELKSGTRIISYRYEVPLLLNKEDKKNSLFLYKI